MNKTHDFQEGRIENSMLYIYKIPFGILNKIEYNYINIKQIKSQHKEGEKWKINIIMMQ